MDIVRKFFYLLLVSILLPWAMISGTVSYMAQQRNVPVMSLRLVTQEGVKIIGLEEYLTGVILAELPSDFPEEAVKAQSVASRTYTLKRMKNPKHTDGDICADSTCCQGYCSPESYLSRGGNRAFVNLAVQAVKDTRGEVLCYGGSLIDAAYFSSAGGSTESAVAVWGTDYPYLIAQSSPEEQRTRIYSFSRKVLCQTLGIPANGDMAPRILSRTAGNGVETVRIGGKEFSGLSLRKSLGICSTNFEIYAEGENLVIQTNGSGHRVGMSQYGACSMAKEGKNYGDILAYYYPGAKIQNYDIEKDAFF